MTDFRAFGMTDCGADGRVDIKMLGLADGVVGRETGPLSYPDGGTGGKLGVTDIGAGGGGRTGGLVTNLSFRRTAVRRNLVPCWRELWRAENETPRQARSDRLWGGGRVTNLLFRPSTDATGSLAPCCRCSAGGCARNEELVLSEPKEEISIWTRGRIGAVSQGRIRCILGHDVP